jgi:tRNA pseudouridine38-40 synthase
LNHGTAEPVVPTGDGGLVRLRLDISYDGTDFSGWATQPSQRTVQATIEAGLAQILRMPVRVTVAGRTDAGVHAQGQVAHVDVAGGVWADLADSLVRRLAGLLPADVRVRSVAVVPAAFDARFSGLWRRYAYHLTDARFGADPLRRRDTVAWPRVLDVSEMAAAADLLLGVHDFAAYCRYREGASTIRGLQALGVSRAGDLVTITAQADAFCHSMVRSLVGALIAVGERRRDVFWPATLLSLSARSSSVPVVAARGLTLMEVGYPPGDQLEARSQVTRNRRDGSASQDR